VGEAEADLIQIQPLKPADLELQVKEMPVEMDQGLPQTYLKDLAAEVDQVQ